MLHEHLKHATTLKQSNSTVAEMKYHLSILKTQINFPYSGLKATFFLQQYSIGV